MLWVVALLLLAVLGSIGYFAGAIRVAFSLAGLLLAALLALPLAPLIKPVLALTGIRHPALTSLLAPALIFILILVAFKIGAQIVHKKVEVLYKYKRTDDERFLFERLNRRLGLCLGLVNGAVYFALLMVPIYVFGYLTVQLATGGDDPAGLQFVNKVRTELHSSNLDRVLAGYDPAPEALYDAGDVAGLIMQNRVLWSRLWHYPVFLTLAERPELQAIANDVEVNQMIYSGATVAGLLKNPKVQALVNNKDFAAEVSRLLGSDLKDLKAYLETGRSEKYGSETLLGRWVLAIEASLVQERKKRPAISSLELNRLRKVLAGNMAGATLTATTDNRIILKGGPDAAGTTPVLSQGSWQKTGAEYQVTYSEKNQSSLVTFQGEDRLTLIKDGMTLAFDREL